MQNIKRKAEQLWNYLPHVPNTVKKPNPVLKRKSQVTDKQVLNLTGGLFPLKLVDPAKDANMIPQKLDHWVYAPIKQRNTKIGPIYHWVKQGQQQKMYHGDKFNIQPHVLQFSRQQFNAIDIDHAAWTYEEVVEIFTKLKNFNFNFIVVLDRLQNDKRWNVQDIKDIYFKVTREIAQHRGQRDTIRSVYIFDKKYQTNRKFELEKYMMRSKVDTDREKNLINEIKRLQIQIKKQEREQINLKKALKLDEAPEQIFKLQQNVDIRQLLHSQKVYSRQQLLTKPSGLPGKIEDRLNEVLSGLNIPEKIVATKQNAELYDNLRKKILLMLSLNRYIRKVQNQKKQLQEKKRRVISLEQQQKKDRSINPLGNNLGQPKKKHKA